MQPPTVTNVFIRTVHDAHRIFYAVYLGVLPMITRRLDVKERDTLRSGCCYAWEDRGPHAITGLGIERFTEGRHWSPSRVREEFLFYYEKYEPSKTRGTKTGDANTDEAPPRDWDPFVKQTYSVWLETDQGRRKWHLTAYFTQATVDQLGTVDDIPALRGLIVPEGMFRSSRTTKSRRGAGANNNNTNLKAATSNSKNTTSGKSKAAAEPAPPPPLASNEVTSSSPARTYAQFPAVPDQNSALLAKDYVTPVFQSIQAPGYGFPTNTTASTQYLPVSQVSQFPSQPGSSSLQPQHAASYTVSRPQDDIVYTYPVQPTFSNYDSAATPSLMNANPNWALTPADHTPHVSYASYAFAPTQTPFPHHAHSYSYPTPPSPSSASDSGSSHVSNLSVSSISSSSPTFLIETPPVVASVLLSTSTSDAPGPLSRMSHPSMVDSAYSTAMSELDTSMGDTLWQSPPPATADGEGAWDGAEKLAPLHALRRHHPYRRDPVDDRALQILDSRGA
ncbi:hypothetical protein EW146_g2278 [Bondarzewia mesenterica]|uniref:cAMP-independent regulatory protein pac2 n=1 Tax=Bondarzewia mesenterica TaxID=1095465 RepID=A0A4S4M3D9_9AGAM|nr:hypothetical protein EW146_g2278 [Bondarzewia mesenterica]